MTCSLKKLEVPAAQVFLPRSRAPKSLRILSMKSLRILLIFFASLVSTCRGNSAVEEHYERSGLSFAVFPSHSNTVVNEDHRGGWLSSNLVQYPQTNTLPRHLPLGTSTDYPCWGECGCTVRAQHAGEYTES